MTTKPALRIWLVVLDLAAAITAYEVAAVQHVFGLHTISHWSSAYHPLGFAILLAMLGIAGWWWHHYHGNQPQ